MHYRHSILIDISIHEPAPHSVKIARFIRYSCGVWQRGARQLVLKYLLVYSSYLLVPQRKIWMISIAFLLYCSGLLWPKCAFIKIMCLHVLLRWFDYKWTKRVCPPAKHFRKIKLLKNFRGWMFPSTLN